jgi:hypothetical protein
VRAALIFIAAALAVWPATAAAQAPQGAHARADGAHDVLLDLPGARRVVPAGAAASGAVVGFGVGGVPSRSGATGASGVVVTAAGGFRAPVIVLLALTVADVAAIGAHAPAVSDTATGEVAPCRSTGGWVACLLTRPGAYAMAPADAAAADSRLDRALADMSAVAPSDQRPPALVLLVVLAAAIIGALVALAVEGDRNAS